MSELAKTNTQLAVLIPEAQIEAAKTIDAVVMELSANKVSGGFQEAFIQSSAIDIISNVLTPEIMKPIKALRGKKLGFLTDLDKDTSGYSDETTKNCVIEAILTGLKVTGNQFNILAAKMYPTKEGFTHLLSKIDGLWQDYVFNIPRKDGDIWVVDVEVNWSINNGTPKNRKLTFPIKVNTGMGSDAILGKAERKAKKWLYESITGNYITDGDVTDVEYTPVSEKVNKPKENKKESVTLDDRNATKEDRNAKVEEAEEVKEDVVEEKILPEVPEAEVKKGDGYLEKATSKADLDKRLKGIQGKYPNFPLKKYNELLEKFV